MAAGRRAATGAAAAEEVGWRAVMNALADPVFVADRAGCFAALNTAAEQFFAASAHTLLGRPVGEVIAGDSPLFRLMDQARRNASSLAQYGISMQSPRFGSRDVSIEIAPIPEMPGSLAVLLREHSIARKIDHQLVHRNAARSVTGMAAMLAHEVKNPLSGIRGAAQLLEQSVPEGERALTRLITEEADRIVALIDRMDMFADVHPIERTAVNIHEVLDHVRRVAETGVASGVRIRESYDPSLPPVLGNRDLLIQALLNLVKNAAEAAGGEDGEIRLSTRYQQGVRLAVPGSGSRVDLPLAVAVQDNGPGIPEDLQAHLFDPFITTKSGGKGLGLALVAKIVGDHGGIIEFDSEPRRTIFRLMLPKAEAEPAP